MELISLSRGLAGVYIKCHDFYYGQTLSHTAPSWHMPHLQASSCKPARHKPASLLLPPFEFKSPSKTKSPQDDSAQSQQTDSKTMTMVSSTDLRNALDQALESEHSSKRKGSISFKVYVVPKSCKTSKEIKAFIDSNELQEVDVCSYLGKNDDYRGLYFDPLIYPPKPFVKHQYNKVWEQLKADICREAYRTASPVVANGPSKKDAQDRVLTCQIVYRRRLQLLAKQKEKREQGGYRKNRLVNDSKENRENGKQAPGEGAAPAESHILF